MMIVVTIIGLIAGISFPAASAGVDAVRLSTTSASIASFLNAAVNRAERLQQPIVVEISPKESRLTMISAQPGFHRELKLPDGITLEAVLTGAAPPPAGPEDAGQPPVRIILMPGTAAPGIGIQFVNKHGARRIVRLDPMTGFPRVESVVTK